ncbi:MAG: EAL domain-containing protein [Motiliproteus sp.]
MHDGLTKLPNLTLLKDRIQHAIEKRRRQPEYLFAVCFLDLDRFKDINDSHGYHTGDHLLKQIAALFAQILRPTDTVARAGGDEFTFLINDIASIDEALEITRRLLQSLNRPFKVNQHTIYTGASVGIYMVDHSQRSAEEMIRDADIAMYRAKESGKGRIDVFNPEMHERAKKTLQIETDLREAMDKNELEIYYQPVIDIHQNSICGFEALLRWHHPTLGSIPPDRFIPIAENSGQIGKIGRWVMEKSCLQTRDWSLQFSPEKHFSLAVNLSGIQLIDPNIDVEIAGILKYSRFNPADLHIEVTETMLISHKDAAKHAIEALHEMGVSISIDDFGTGYCSLTYLQEYHFDTLKIDKSFVQDMEASGKGRQLVRTLMLLARDLRLSIVAEGVETKKQLDRLTAMNCPYVQGYYFSQPLPASAIEILLGADKHHDAQKLISLPQLNQAETELQITIKK